MFRPRAALAAIVMTVWSGASWANNGVNSEISHVASGAAIAAAVTAVADRFGAEDRRWVGFATTVGISLVEEGVQVLTTGPRQIGPSAMDFVATFFGATFGAWATDRYLLTPVVTRDAAGHRAFGVAMRMSF
jgi:hypothetical protein